MPTTEIRRLLQDLAAPLESGRWPRASVIRRAGAARRRTHTVIGAAVATTALLVSGSLVATGSGAQPTSLSEEKATNGVDVHEPGSVGKAVIDQDTLLSSSQVERFGSKLDWEETSTSDNLGGDGLVAPCQRERFADPDGLAALARTWEGSTTKVVKKTVGKGDQRRTSKKSVTAVQTTAVQLVERSRDEDRAAATFEAASLWFAGCADPRTQLVATNDVTRVGDDARQFRLRTWGRTPSTITVGMALTGSLVVTNVGPQPRGRRSATRRRSAGWLLPSTRCAAPTAPPPAPDVPAAAARHRSTSAPRRGSCRSSTCRPCPRSAGPWVGTDPSRAGSTNFASTRCDRTTFTGKGISLAKTRTFLFPETRNADQLGLTQVDRLDDRHGGARSSSSRSAPASDSAARPTSARQRDPAGVLVVEGPRPAASGRSRPSSTTGSRSRS